MALHLEHAKYITHQHTCKEDYEGRVVTTLIESKLNKASSTQTILYIHGFNDYFFQLELLDFYAEHHVNFFALDLRKCGRSYLKFQHPNYCKSMTEYFEDLDYGIDFIRKQNPNTELVFLGHSTGGLLASYYGLIGAQKHLIKGLILNSPFFEFNLPYLVRVNIPWLMWFGLKIHPYLAFTGGVSPIYGQSLLKSYGGEWEFDTLKKPMESFPAYLAWIRSVYKVQRIVAKSKLKQPILLMHSDKSSNPKTLNSEARKSDIVLNVKHIHDIGINLSDQLQVCVVQDGMHDLFLSRKEVRNKALQATLSFLSSLK